MSSQHQPQPSSLLPIILSCMFAVVLFVASVWTPMQLWRPLTCALNEYGSCDFDPTVALLGVAVAAFAHSTTVAVFAWTPLSAPLRSSSKDAQQRSFFSTFLYTSIACDVVAYGYALTFMEGLIGFLQALVITFNAPFFVFAPYLAAAYNDPYTDLGSYIHGVKSHVIEYYRSEQLACSPDSPRAEPECVHARLERALLILPHSRESLECQGCRERYSFNHDGTRLPKMRTYPKFSLFVTPPTDVSLEQYMPLPVSQQA